MKIKWKSCRNWLQWNWIGSISNLVLSHSLPSSLFWTHVCLRLSTFSPPSLYVLPCPSSSSSFLLSSMWVDEPGDPRPGHIDRLCGGECPAVPDRCDAHSPPLHPEKRGWCAPHRLPVQPQPRRRELHTGRTSTCSHQRRPAHPRLGAALAEVHHLLRERLWWVEMSESRWWSGVSHKHAVCT